MERWSYDELKEYIHEDIAEFMRHGLDIRQATSRVQVEYKKSIEESKVEKLVIYLVLCEEGVKNGFLRNDIKSDTVGLLNGMDNEALQTELNQAELDSLKEYKEQVTKLLEPSEKTVG